MSWIESHSRLSRHPDIFELERIVNISRAEAVGYIFILWDSLAVFDDCLAINLTVDYVEMLVGWKGKRGLLFNALKKTGWINKNGTVNFKDCAHIIYGGKVKRTNRYGWRKLRLKILKRDNYKCHYCGKAAEIMHVDHIIPVTKGGEDVEVNLVAACQSCNVRKSNKSVEEFLNALS